MRTAASPVYSDAQTMTLSRFALLLTLVLPIAACGPAEDSGQIADLIVVNADVYTSDPEQPRATAFAVSDGRFIAIGSDDEARAFAGDTTELIDAGGNTVIPGLIDGHTHLVGGGTLATGVDLTEIEDKREWLRMIAAKLETLEAGEWLLGGRWDHNLSDGILPDKGMLDSVAPDNPVLLEDIDGHTQWANSLAIELAGIIADMSVPSGTVIVTDPDSGELTGIFKEADVLFGDAPGMADATDAEAGIRAAVRMANSLGITSMHDMSFEHDAFLAVLESGDLTVRIWQGYRGERDDADVAEAYFAAAADERERVRQRVAAIDQTRTRGPLFEIGYVKLVIDGVLSTHTAMMKEPYADRPDIHVEPFLSRDQLTGMIAAAHANGFPVAVHAIGDDGVSWVLDAFEASPSPPGMLPDRIEHIEVVTPDDVGRFRELRVVASMQPHHATCCVGNYVIDRIGRERMPNAYAWRRMLDEDVFLVLGSDWPTAPLDPLIQMADTLHRETRIDGAVRPWDEDQTLTFEEALRGFTRAPAKVTAWSDEIGSITTGKWADFVILDQPLPQPVDASVGEADVTATYLAGQQVYP